MIAWLYEPLRRWTLRHRQYTGGGPILDALYAEPDPWNLASDDEQVRFVATNAAIARLCPPLGTLLEIGCGEGHQTMHLLHVAGHVTAIDISPTAVARATARAPGASYRVGEIASLRSEMPLLQYDVATLCEILYYVDDPAAMVRHAQSCAGHVIVTIYEPQSKRLAPLFGGAGWQELPPIHVRAKRWRAYHWARVAVPSPDHAPHGETGSHFSARCSSVGG